MKKVYSFLTALLVTTLLIPWQLNAQILLDENFDDLTSGVPEGWVAEGTYSKSWQSTKDSYTSGWENSYGVFFNCYSASTGLTAILKSPVIDLSSSSKDMILSFYLYDADEDDIKVYLSKDGGATYESTLLLECAKISGWQTIEIPLAAYKTESNVCIVWHGVSSYGYSRPTLDNIMIAPAPSCAQAENLAVTDVTQNDATLTWSLAQGKGAAAEEYAIEVFLNGEEEAVVSETVTPEVADGVYSYTIEGEFNSGTGYYFTVKGLCGADDEAVIAESSVFYTLCDPYEIPLVVDSMAEEALIPCWTLNDADINAGTLYLNTSKSYLASPQLNFAANNLEVKLSYIGTSKDAGFYYGVASDATLSDFDTLGYVKHTATYAEKTISVNTATTDFGDATGKVFAICPDEYMYVTSIDIHEKPCCPRVEQVSATVLDSASVELSWLGTASSYNVAFVDTVTNTVISRTATTNPVTLDGLNPQTTYAVLVQAVCEGCEEASALSDSVFFTTLCGAAAEATFNESFEYEELGSVMPECWVESKPGTWIVNHNISIYDTPSNAPDGYSAIYMYYYEYYSIPKGQTATFSPQPFKVETAGQYDVKFAMYRYSKQYYSVEGDGTLTVWANNRPDTVGAVKVCEIDRYFEYAPAEKAAGWYYYDFNIPTITGTVYLVFEGKNNAINNLYLDDISVYPAPTCRKVRNIDLGTPTTTTVPVQWEAAEGTSQWVIDYVVLAGTDTLKVDSTLTSENPFVVEGLNSSTAYKIKGTVATYCDAENRGEAIPFEYDFQTACEAFSAFPYFEGFEGSFPPICWEMKNTAGSSEFVWKQYDYSTYVYEGNYAAYWSYKSSGSKAILVTPEFTFPEDEDYRIELYAFRGTSGSSYTGEGFGIYLSDTKEVTEDATLLAFIPRLTSESNENGVFAVGTVGAQGMYQYRFDFNTTELSGKYIIFEAVTNNGYYQSFDNFWIGPKPAVDAISGFTVDSVVVDAARLTIPDTLVTSFDVVYGEVGFDPTAVEESSIVTVTGREYLFSNLTPETEYEVYVRNRKDDKVSDWSRNPVKFRTLCAPFVVDADNFYVEDFESYEANVTDLGCLVQSYGGSYNYRIATEMEYYDNSSWEYVKKYPSNGSNMAYLSSANNSWLFRAVQLKAGQNYSISVDGLECSSYYEAKLSFGVATTPDRSAVTPCLEGYALPDRSDWERVTGYFTVPADGVYYVGVGIAYGGGTVGIDSLVIRTEACIPPAVTIAAISDASVSFELQSDAYTWDFYYSTSNFDIDTINAELFTTVEELTYNLEGLESNTTYYYVFRSNDEEGNASSWTPVSSFKTECGAVGLPVVLNFEAINIDGCWVSKKEGSIYDGAISRRGYNNIEGSYSMMADEYNYVFISPRVDADLSNTQGSVWGLNYYDVASSPAYQVKMVVGVTNNPQAAEYFAVDTILVDVAQNAGQTIAEYPFSFESLKENAEYKDAKYVVFEILEGAYGFIDYFNLDVIPTCPKPTEFEATAVTANSITLDWVAAGEETSWSVLVKQAADTVQTLVANEHPLTITGLTGNTTYSFELRALCAADDSSKVVELKNIITDCDVFTLPYEDDLNGIPACWTIEDKNSNDYWSWTSYSGMTALITDMADSYLSDTARLFSPEFVFDKKYVMNIDMYTYFEAGTFNVLFDNGTTRDTIVAGYQHHNAWETCTYDMSEYEGQTGRLVFEGWGPQLTSGWTAYWYIRNLSIVEPPVQYVVAGTSALTGFEWNNSENVMALNAETGIYSLTFSNVPAGEHQFKVSEFANWDAAYGFANLAADNATNVYDFGGNVAFTLAAAADVTVEFNAEAKTVKVTTTGNFIDPVVTTDIYVAGSAGLCNGETWNPSAEVNKLAYDYATGEYVKVFSNVAAGTYEFKVTTPTWDPQYTVVDAECSDEGWEGGNGINIKFTLAETADVTIKLTAEQKVCLTSTLGEFGEVEITSYTLVGSAAIFGTADDVNNTANDMLQEGETNTWTKVYEDVLLDVATYNYKVVGNHAYEVFEFPGAMASNVLDITQAGYYTITFTFVAGEEPTLTAEAVKYVAPEAPAIPTIEYGGGYFTSDMLQVVVNTTETRPAYILVTIDGSEPSFEGVMTGATLPATPGQPIQLTATTVVKVRGMLVDATSGQPYQNPDGTYVYSEIAEATFTKVAAPAAPVFTPTEGEYTGEVEVSIACETENVLIKYEFGGTEPTGMSATYTEAFKLTETTTVSAIAYLVDAEGAPIMTVDEMPVASAATFATYTVKPEEVTVSAPVFTPTPGDYLDQESLNVTLYCATPDALIYWTYGEDATVNQYSFVYEGAIPVDAQNNVISAVAILMDDDLNVVAKSDVVYATYNLKEEVVEPVEIRFNPAPGEYEGEVTVSIEYINADGAVMKLYSIDGTDPMREYKEPIHLTETTTVKARVMLSMSPSMTFSETVEATYTIKPKDEPIVVSAPVFTPAPGDYLDQESLDVTLYCATPDALIYWTYGEDATVNQYSFVYEGAIPVDAQNNVISAVAILMDDDLNVVAKSDVVYATYNLKEEVVEPVEIRFTPEAGEYTDEVTVVIEYINAENAMMKLYSIDGTDPMREYRDPIHLTETTTVKARVMLTMSPSFTYSETVEATYIIVPGTGVGTDDAQLAAVVYAKDGLVYVAAQEGAMIEVFTVQGQCIYSAEATDQLTTIDALNSDVVLVKVNGETVKVAIK